MHTHSTFFHFFRNRQLNHLYISTGIRAFAIAMIGIFIPIYLYKLDYSFQAIFLFFGLAALFSMIFLIPASKIAYRVGLKHAILYSMPPLIIFFLLLLSLQDFNWPLSLLALFIAGHTSLFWFAYHVDFSKFSNKKDRGKQVGFSMIVVSVFSVIGPVLGGIILSIFGFKPLFLIVSFLLLVSTIPLFFSKEIHEPVNFSLKGFFRGQKLRDILGYIGNGIEIRIGTILWPLFIFIFILEEKYFSLGIASSIAFSMALIFTVIMGKFSDINRKLVLKVGTIFNSVVWVVKSFIVTPLQVFIMGAFYGASQATMQIPFNALNYDKAKEKNRGKIILEREIYIKLGGVIFLFALSFMADRFIEMFRYAGPLSSLMRFFF